MVRAGLQSGCRGRSPRGRWCVLVGFLRQPLHPLGLARPVCRVGVMEAPPPQVYAEDFWGNVCKALHQGLAPSKGSAVSVCLTPVFSSVQLGARREESRGFC